MQPSFFLTVGGMLALAQHIAASTAGGMEWICPSLPVRTDSTMYSLRLPENYRLDGTRGRKICFRSASHFDCFTSSKSPNWDSDHANTFVTYFSGYIRSGTTTATAYEDGRPVHVATCDIKVEPFPSTVQGTRPRDDVRVVDAFMIFDEVELARMRFELLDDVVDAFIVVESEITHSGKQKPLHFQRSLHTFPKRIRDKIIHVVVPEQDYSIIPGTPMQAVPHVREKYQRDQLLRGFLDQRLTFEGIDPENVIVVFGDADEIPRASSIDVLRSVAPLKNPTALSMSWHHYAYNFASHYAWGAFGAYNEGVFAVTKSMLQNVAPSAFRRAMRMGFSGLLFADMTNAGWHFSRFGGFESVKRKMLASANFGFHQIDETDDSVLDMLVSQGVPVLNLRGGIDGTTLFSWEPSERVALRLPRIVRAGRYAEFFWDDYHRDARRELADHIAVAAARLKRLVERTGAAELFVRGSGDKRATVGDVYTIRKRDVDLFPALCARLRVRNKICDAIFEGMRGYFSSGRGISILVSYSRTTTFFMELQNGFDSFDVKAHSGDNLKRAQQKARSMNLADRDTSVFMEAIRKIEEGLACIFQPEGSHVVLVAR